MMIRGKTVCLVICTLASYSLPLRADINVAGTVIDANGTPIPGVTEIRISRQGGGREVRFSLADGTYSFTLPGDAPINSLLFLRNDRHPGLIQNIGRVIAAADDNEIKKVLFVRSGPIGFERNIEQLLVYEWIFLDSRSQGQSIEDIREAFSRFMQDMPRAGAEQLAGLSSMQIDLLENKRKQVYETYGMTYKCPNADVKPACCPARKCSCGRPHTPRRSGLFRRRCR